MSFYVLKSKSCEAGFSPDPDLGLFFFIWMGSDLIRPLKNRIRIWLRPFFKIRIQTFWAIGSISAYLFFYPCIQIHNFLIGQIGISILDFFKFLLGASEITANLYRNVAWFAVYICGNIWSSLYAYPIFSFGVYEFYF